MEAERERGGGTKAAQCKKTGRERESSPIVIRTLKTDTHNESELIIVRGNGRRGPIYRRFIGRKSNATAYQLAKVTPPQFNVQKQWLLRRWCTGWRGLKQFTVICNGIILLAMNHFSSYVIPYNGNRKSILICALLSMGRRKEKCTDGGHLFSWDQAAIIVSQQLVEVMSLSPPLNSPRWNIRAPIPPAKLHHLAGKASKSCYKLREDRVAHHLWTLHWSPGDVIRIIPSLFDAPLPPTKTTKKTPITTKLVLIVTGFKVVLSETRQQTQRWQRHCVEFDLYLGALWPPLSTKQTIANYLE